MKQTVCGGLLMLALLKAASSLAQPPSDSDMKDCCYPVAENAHLVLISNQFSFTEGPVADRQGNVFFTDQPDNKIWKYGINGELSVFMDPAGRANGMYFTESGDLIVCADEHNQLWSISPEKKVSVLVGDVDGRLLNGPNDVWVAPGGDIYFTDPYYQRPYWQRTQPPLEKQSVWLLKNGSRQIVTVADDLEKPNGIVGSADGKYLYVADIKGNKTFRYAIREDGTISDKKLFAEQGSDGITLDRDGNLYLTGKGVTVYSPGGVLVRHIEVSADRTSNVCFGGPNKDWLFITAGKNIFKLKMQVKGL